ncbi:MAG TPA: hypothetical protein PKC43_11090 [Phycisphaerales bacterium]|nr:hypothetical protein [Phycisphaerales bacterium]HMP37978.1 hypothetical protein [Phycisphaerales bacterium]
MDRDSIADLLSRHRRAVVATAAALAIAGLVAGGAAWWSSRWKPPPSIFDSPVDGVMAYLAMEDFSRLPIEERIRFLRDFADRFRGLSQSESAVLAGFLAGLSGPARETLRQNVRLMAKEILADGAGRYLAIGDEAERRRFLDEWVVEWMRMGERIAEGRERTVSDADRLAEARRDGRREAERRPRRPVTFETEGAIRFLDFWQQDVEAASTPKEQGQIVRFLTDLRDHIVRE